jgi:cobalt-zinc-cadmium efflux system outer membrane protein
MKVLPLIAARMLLAGALSLAGLPLRAQDLQPVQARQADQAALQLDEIVKQALERSPEVQGAEHAIQALTHKVPQAQALPDPTVAVGWAGNLAPFSTMSGDASSYRGITVSQQFPVAGKLKLQGAMAQKDIEAAQTEYEAIRRRITAEVKTTYYDYFYVDKAIKATEQNKDLLDKLSKIAEAQYRVGKAMQQDVLRSQVEISMLTEKLTELEQRKATSQARINAYLQQSPETPLPPAADVEPVTIRYQLDELYNLSLQNDTAADRAQKIIERGRIGVTLAQKQYRPDVSVSYMYQQRTAQPDMNGVTVSVNIPVFYKSKQRQAVVEATQDVLSAEKMRESRLNEVRFELKQDYLAAQAADRLISLYSKAIVPQSSLALESSMAGYQVGKVDFQSLLANFTTVLNYETDYYRQLADYLTAIARIESLTGVDITAPATIDNSAARKGF